MQLVETIHQKIKTVVEAKQTIAAGKVLGKTFAFTNGCFDILHPGHLYSLAETAKEADYLIVGLNSDTSVKRLKGPDRPINNTNDRALILANLLLVDMVVIFEEDTPLELISSLLPDVLVKGGDYDAHSIVGADIVTAKGGEVLIVPTVEGFSTSGLIQQMKS